LHQAELARLKGHDVAGDLDELSLRVSVGLVGWLSTEWCGR
jgi:hypothetical protein